ncbi:MAG TPA: ATP-binding protein, partial [Bacillota bacterium]|nr:ATP-binding protein [Bacillota bacterium]
SAIAENMAKLDFTKMYPVKTQDEIGELGRSINSLSEQLGRSITELQEANLRLEEDNERQKRIDEMRKEFISNVSHELKTPIALIQGYAEGLRLNIAGDQEDRDFYCNVITDEAEKMHKLVKDLLDLSAIDSGCMQLDKERFDLAELTAEVLGKYHLIMKDKDIKVYIEKDGEAWVHADIWRIEQVIVNLIDNAVAHIEGERILKINITVEERRVRFAVFNSGTAIPEDSLDKVWLSFYKIDKARTRTRGGSGLGLSIVRAILEQHQGCYGVRNRMNGVEFWFELKLSQEVNES